MAVARRRNFPTALRSELSRAFRALKKARRCELVWLLDASVYIRENHRQVLIHDVNVPGHNFSADESFVFVFARVAN